MGSSPMGKKTGKVRRKRGKPRRYTPELRAKAVGLAQRYPEKSLKALAEELGVGYDTFVGWVRKADSDHGSVAAPGETLEQKVKRLERENTLLREEREILKKAATFFAKESE